MNYEQKFWSRYYQVREIIRTTPGISNTQLTNKTSSFTKQERLDLLAMLVSKGEIRIDVRDGKTKPTTYYWPLPQLDEPDPSTLAIPRDPSTMTYQEIEEVNWHRKIMNAGLIAMGAVPFPMLGRAEPVS